MSDTDEALLSTLFSEIFTVEQLLRGHLKKVLPKGMELSHFVVLNHLALAGRERSPAQLANTLNVTRGAMTNTLSKLDAKGYIHIRPDWDDARRKNVAISASGQAARDVAVSAISPFLADVVEQLGSERIRGVLPVLRELRTQLGGE